MCGVLIIKYMMCLGCVPHNRCVVVFSFLLYRMWVVCRAVFLPLIYTIILLFIISLLISSTHSFCSLNFHSFNSVFEYLCYHFFSLSSKLLLLGSHLYSH